MKRPSAIPTLDLNKDRLLEIEDEISHPWIELREEIIAKLKSKFISHNAEVKKTGFSFIISTEKSISEKIFTEKEIETISTDEKGSFFKKELIYPTKAPTISYKDSNFETNELSTIDDLYRCNIKPHFQKLQMEIWGKDNKYISLTFSSDSSFLESDEGNEINVNYPEDESVGVVERIKAFVKHYETPRSYFHLAIFKVMVQIGIPVLTVYAFNKLYGIIAPAILEKDMFYNFISIFLYFMILGAAMIYCDKLYNHLFPSTLLIDRKSDKQKWIWGKGFIYITGLIGIDYIIQFFKWIYSFLKK